MTHTYVPGDVCDRTGAFRAVHRSHREPHDVLVFFGDRFPSCKWCGHFVRFKAIFATEAVNPLESFERDEDLELLQRPA